MPPRFPHRLVKPPTKMDKSEMAVFAVLGVSVTFGLMQMGSDALKIVRGESGKDDGLSKSAACPMNW
eukprot:CAMPEP_0183721502 /NCGR_PEP_ID=MMETSP0737-20130205/13757_1 /TAXON_ID=385413 /ORGANISM="Thalassiosira miniscula, Strain CCMP1093" /LENGTH=66 /DNA_ID=CAMNT_0025951515 /DNA_START=269 /DNA_END=466 /DNA_ORIENTATION=+